MKILLIISAFVLTLSFSAKANMDCVYNATKSGITITLTSPCVKNKYQPFVDSFVNQLAFKINRIDTSYKILVFVNYEEIFYDFSGNPDYFTSLGVDTLREINSDFINHYCYGKYGNTNQSKPNPLNINATNDKKASKEIGVKIIYNIDYRKKINWTEVEKLVIFSANNFKEIKATQQIDTASHYSWYITLPTLDTTAINKIMGWSQNNEIKPTPTKTNPIFYKTIIFLGIILLIFALIYKKRGG